MTDELLFYPSVMSAMARCCGCCFEQSRPQLNAVVLVADLFMDIPQHGNLKMLGSAGSVCSEYVQSEHGPSWSG